MQRRAALREVADGLKSRADVCDAHPALVRAGAHLGDDPGEDCPICHEPDSLRHVSYAFYRGGPRQQGGQPVPSDKLGGLLEKHGQLRVYVVEVCPSCHWHHVLEARTMDRPVRRGAMIANRRPLRG